MGHGALRGQWMGCGPRIGGRSGETAQHSQLRDGHPGPLLGADPSQVGSGGRSFLVSYSLPHVNLGQSQHWGEIDRAHPMEMEWMLDVHVSSKWQAKYELAGFVRNWRWIREPMLRVYLWTNIFCRFSHFPFFPHFHSFSLPLIEGLRKSLLVFFSRETNWLGLSLFELIFAANSHMHHVTISNPTALLLLLWPQVESATDSEQA